MNSEFTTGRRTFLLGLLGAAFPVGSFVKRNADLAVGLRNDYVPAGKDGAEASDFYRFGTLAQLAAFTHFPSEPNFWLAYIPCIGTFYSDNWSLSRLMSTTILQEQARAVLNTSYRPVLTEDMKRTIKGLDDYKVNASSSKGLSYAGQPISSYILGEDVWCDDNAWIMRNYLAIYKMMNDLSALEIAQKIFLFAVSNWQGQASCAPGGIPWKQQKIHELNHDRNTVSNAPVAMAGYELYSITKDPFYLEWALRIHKYQMTYFVYKTRVYDHINQDCEMDKTFWTYTHGVVIGMNRLLHTTSDGGHDALAIAEEIAKASIATFEASQLTTQPAAYVDIYFQELYSLYQVTHDRELRARIPNLVVTYARALWDNKSIHKSNHLFKDEHFNVLEGIPNLHLYPSLVTLNNQAGIANIFYTAACILAK